MSDQSNPLVTEQSPPIPNARPAVWDLVLADMRDRDAAGRAKYGTPLQPHNGRDPLVDLYQELLDAVVYARQEIQEREDWRGRALAAEAFKAWVHAFLDERGVPADPDPEANQRSGCRIGCRLRWVFDRVERLKAMLDVHRTKNLDAIAIWLIEHWNTLTPLEQQATAGALLLNLDQGIGEIDRLRAAIRRHRDYRGDDRCYLSDGELYGVLPEGDTRPTSDTAVTIENCARYIECRQQGREYVSPQRRIEELEAEIARLKGNTYCAYCGFEISADKDAQFLSDHIRSCTKHPLWAFKATLVDLRHEVARAIQTLDLANDDPTGKTYAVYAILRDALKQDAEP